MLIPFGNARYIWGEKTRTSAWSNVSVDSYFLLKNGTSIPSVHLKIASIMNPLVAKNYKPGEYLVRLQPVKDIYFGPVCLNLSEVQVTQSTHIYLEPLVFLFC